METERDAAFDRILFDDASAAEVRIGSEGAWLTRDRLFELITSATALAVLVMTVGLTVSLLVFSKPSLLHFGVRFLEGTEWDPVREQFGALPFVWGTLVSSAIALAIAAPLGIGVALFFSEICPRRVGRPLEFMVGLLASIPSVVYGLWAIFVLGPILRDRVEPVLGRFLGFLPLFATPPLSVSVLSAGVILALMILPYICSLCADILRTVPELQKEAALSLGATWWETVRIAVFPWSRSAMVGAIMLALGRALGETIAVAMIIGNSPQISFSLFMPGATLASVIANEFAEATDSMYQSSLVELGLVLMVLVLALNILARSLVIGPHRQV